MNVPINSEGSGGWRKQRMLSTDLFPLNIEQFERGISYYKLMILIKQNSSRIKAGMELSWEGLSGNSYIKQHLFSGRHFC